MAASIQTVKVLTPRSADLRRCWRRATAGIHGIHLPRADDADLAGFPGSSKLILLRVMAYCGYRQYSGR